MRRHGLLRAILVAFCTSLVAAGFAQGADRPSAAAPGVVTPPSDPVARAAFDVLAKHCSRCHQEGPTLTKRLKPAKNFGDILKLDELAKTPQLILPGNPDASKLFTQIASQEMPYDLYNEFDTSVPAVSEADVKALRTWIESLGTAVLASCERRKFIRDGQV